MALWRGTGRIEVQVDDSPWREAELTTSLPDTEWVKSTVLVTLDAGRHQVRVRATDGAGQVQTVEETMSRPDGATGHDEIFAQVE